MNRSEFSTTEASAIIRPAVSYHLDVSKATPGGKSEALLIRGALYEGAFKFAPMSSPERNNIISRGAA
jgi:hypothetical protein